jgi:hypothetical protein
MGSAAGAARAAGRSARRATEKCILMRSEPEMGFWMKC